MQELPGALSDVGVLNTLKRAPLWLHHAAPLWPCTTTAPMVVLLNCFFETSTTTTPPPTLFSIAFHCGRVGFTSVGRVVGEEGRIMLYCSACTRAREQGAR